MQAFRDLATTGFALSLFASVAFAQSVVELPANLADPGTQVVNVLTQDPRAGQNNRNIGFSEGPAVDSAGNLYFSENVVSELNSPKIWKVTPTGTASVLYESSIATNGLEFDPQGRLLAVANGMVLRFYPNGTRDTLIRNNILVNLNDLSINSSGYVLLTNYTGNKLFLLFGGQTLSGDVQHELLQVGGSDTRIGDAFLHLPVGGHGRQTVQGGPIQDATQLFVAQL